MRTQKILAFSILAMFLLSIPAFAEEGSDATTTNTEITKERIDAVKTTDSQPLEKPATVTDAESELAAARERYEAAKAALASARERYDAAKVAWERVKAQFNSGTDRVTFGKALAFLHGGSDQILEYMDSLKDKIDEVQGWDDSKKADLKSEIDGYMATLNDAKAALDSVDLNTTEDSDRTAIHTAAADLRDAWNDIRPQLKRIVGEIMAQRIQNGIDKGQNTTARIDAKIAELKSQGLNVTILERFNEKFKENLADAQDNVDMALAALEEVKTSSTPGEKLDEASKYLRMATKDLNDMQAFLKRLANKVTQADRTGHVESAPDDLREPESEHDVNTTIIEEHD